MPERPVIIDTGPLIALLTEGEPNQAWASEQLKLLPTPFLTCEPVVTETFHLLRRGERGWQQFFQMLRRGFIRVDFSIMDELEALEAMMRKYRDLPMSLADACLVRMAERHPSAILLTLDSHFKIYRKHGRQMIPVMMPER